MRYSIFLKSILFSILFLIADYQSVAQSPESMNYQAVIRDGSGNVLSSQSVSLRIKILQGSASGSSVYIETFTPTTNAYGSIAIQIGTGTVVSGTFNTIDWGGNTHFVETAVDIDGTANGTSYVVISTTQLMSVPYALHAKSSDAWSTNSNLNFTNNKVSVGNTSSSNQTYPLSVVTVHDGITSRGIDVLRTDNSGSNIGVPMSFSMLNSNNQPFEFGKVLGRTESNTAGSEVGGLSFHVADGTGTWGQFYQQERMRIDNGRITAKVPFRLEPLSSAPSSPSEGDMYYDNVANQVKVYNGSSWDNLAGGSSSPWTELSGHAYITSGNVGIGNNSPQSVLHLGSNSNLAYNYGTTLTISGNGNTPGSGGTSRIYFENTSNTSNKIAAFSYGGNLLNIGALTNSGSSWNGWMMSLNVDNKIVTVENTLKVEDSLEVTGKSIFSNLSGSGDRMVVANSSGTLSTQAIPSGSSSPWTESGTDIYRSSGNVGIGTTSPTSLLQISDGNAQGPTFKIDGLSPSILLQDNSGVSNTVDNFEIRNNLGSLNFSYGDNSDANDDGFLSNTALTISSIGNVGIGNSDPKERLQLGNNMFFHANSIVNALMFNQYWNGSNWTYANDGPTSGVEFNSSGTGQINFWTSTSGTAGNQVTPQSRFSILNDGTTRISDLAGTGDRMVVADADGDLSTQAIPSGGSSMPNGSNNGDMMYWDGSAWQTIAVGSAGAVLQIINGVPTWVSSPDITGPTITLNGSANMNVVVGGTFTDPGATTDEGTITTSGSVDATTAGTYTITYTATDATGNTATSTRTVAVYQSQFNYTGSAQTFTVPAGVTSISVDAYGANGESTSSGYCYGLEGKGGRVQADLTVTPGDVLNIYVGGSNYYFYGTQGQAGWNGGGSGSGSGSGGGGATDIRIGGTALADRVLVVGGGGGAYGCGGELADGCDGGGLIGETGNRRNSGAYGGTGGTQSAAGTGGASPDFPAEAGSAGSGANGGSGGGPRGSGGGGGYYGGGGGASGSGWGWGGGGGGSSYTHPTLCSSVIHTQGAQAVSSSVAVHGSLIITIP